MGAYVKGCSNLDLSSQIYSKIQQTKTHKMKTIPTVNDDYLRKQR